jgi:hypothetical protein
MTRRLICTGSLLLSTFLCWASPPSTTPEDLTCNGPCGEGMCSPEPKWELSAVEERTVVVLYGTVVRAETLGDGDCYADVTFRVQKGWKGAPTPMVILRTGSPCARPWPFAIGRRYLVSGVKPRMSGWPPEVDWCRFAPIDEASAPPVIYKLDHLATHGKAEATP